MAFKSTLATNFARLYIPGKPLLLTNVYDSISARTVAALSGAQALATASYAVAAAAGLSDDDLTLETNLAAVRGISRVGKEYGLPLTVDWQDGYGDRLEEGIKKLLELAVVGINIEDCDKEAKKMMPIEVAVERVKKVRAVAKSAGVEDFVVNARTDTLVHNGSIPEAIERARAYLAGGATTVFVWGGRVRGGITREEVRQLVEAFDGKLNVSLRMEEGFLTAEELVEMGVARISTGPGLQLKAMETLGKEAEKLLDLKR